MAKKDGRLRMAAGAAAAALWLLAGIAAVILWSAGHGGGLAREMLRCAPPETTGLLAGDYEGVCRMTAAYLTGKTDRFQYEILRPDGQTVPCFNEREAAHMADCRGLIRLDRIVLWVALGGAAGLTAWGGFRREGRKAFCRGILRGLLAAGFAAAALLAWALVNFDGLFITFHRVAFSNDGWLLDPRTDLLIRLMPESFFVRLGVKGLLMFLPVPLVLAGTAAGVLRKKKGNDG